MASSTRTSKLGDRRDLRPCRRSVTAYPDKADHESVRCDQFADMNDAIDFEASVAAPRLVLHADQGGAGNQPDTSSGPVDGSVKSCKANMMPMSTRRVITHPPPGVPFRIDPYANG